MYTCVAFFGMGARAIRPQLDSSVEIHQTITGKTLSTETVAINLVLTSFVCEVVSMGCLLLLLVPDYLGGSRRTKRMSNPVIWKVLLLNAYHQIAIMISVVPLRRRTGQEDGIHEVRIGSAKKVAFRAKKRWSLRVTNKNNSRDHTSGPTTLRKPVIYNLSNYLAKLVNVRISRGGGNQGTYDTIQNTRQAMSYEPTGIGDEVVSVHALGTYRDGVREAPENRENEQARREAFATRLEILDWVIQY